jgi:hypothetical protein
MGIGPEHSFSADIKKKLRVGTVKQLKEVGELYKDLRWVKFIVTLEKDNPQEYEQELNKWLEVLNIITIEGFTREEFEDSFPDSLGNAISRFLYE